jgi:hypothetical protein
MAINADPVIDPERRQRLLDIVDEIGPTFRERAPQYDREASFPFENFDDLYDAGFYGLCIPTRYGGLGASFNDYMHIGAAIGAYCPMTALTFNMHTQTVLWTGVAADDLDMSDEHRAAHEALDVHDGVRLALGARHGLELCGRARAARLRRHGRQDDRHGHRARDRARAPAAARRRRA